MVETTRSRGWHTGGPVSTPVWKLTGRPHMGAGLAERLRNVRGVAPLLALARLLRTTRHIPVAQLAARGRFMLRRQLYASAPRWPISAAAARAAGTATAVLLPRLPMALLAPAGMEAVTHRAARLAGGRFRYIGIEVDFSGGVRWRDPTCSPLWIFNLHYLDAVTDLTLAGDALCARELLASWSSCFGETWDPVAWHPYPVSQRIANLCAAASHAGSFGALGASAPALVAMHAAYLLTHLEHDLRGNHLLENAYALLCAGKFLRGRLATECLGQARALLAREVPEQILPDGAHFELSPMYHCIALLRLLQAAALLEPTDTLVTRVLQPAVQRMTHFLRGVRCPDGDIPLLGDSARGGAPPVAGLLRSASFVVAQPDDERVVDGIRSFPNSGLHVLRATPLWAIFDAGPVCPDYLPGHGQADSLTVEIWCGSACIVTDPGVYDYTGLERAWGRSSRAHSTLTVNDADTSEVYDSFRIGGRARLLSNHRAVDSVTATLEPFGHRGVKLSRRVSIDQTTAGRLRIEDCAIVPAGQTVRARLHLHPDISLPKTPSEPVHQIIVEAPTGRIRIDAQQPLILESGRASREFGRLDGTTIVVQTLRPGSARGVVRGAFTLQMVD